MYPVYAHRIEARDEDTQVIFCRVYEFNELVSKIIEVRRGDVNCP